MSGDDLGDADPRVPKGSVTPEMHFVPKHVSGRNAFRV
jgi:hypothetical protein